MYFLKDGLNFDLQRASSAADGDREKKEGETVTDGKDGGNVDAESDYAQVRNIFAMYLKFNKSQNVYHYNLLLLLLFLPIHLKIETMLKDLLQFEFGFLNFSFPWIHFQVQKLVASPKTSPAQSSSGIGTASPRALSPNVDREGDFDTLEADRNSTKSPTSTLDSRFAMLYS